MLGRQDFWIATYGDFVLIECLGAADEIVVVFVALLVWTERVCVVRVSLVLVSA